MHGLQEPAAYLTGCVLQHRGDVTADDIMPVVASMRTEASPQRASTAARSQVLSLPSAEASSQGASTEGDKKYGAKHRHFEGDDHRHFYVYYGTSATWTTGAATPKTTTGLRRLEPQGQAPQEAATTSTAASRSTPR